MRTDPPAQSYALAIDIGGTKLASAVIDVEGRRRGDISTLSVPFKVNGEGKPEADAQALVKIIDDLRCSVDVALEGIGLSICGNVDEDTGMVPLSPNLHWRYLPFGKMVAEQTRL